MFQKGQKGKQILVLASVILLYIIVIGFNATSIAILLPSWAEQFNFTNAQYGLIAGGISLGALFSVFISGIIFDKVKNYKNMLFIILIISGVTISVRSFAHDFSTIYLALIFYGVTASFVGTGCYKMLPQWFGSKSLYIALGMVTSGGSIGYVLGFTITPVANAAIGWSSLFLYQGIIIAAIGLLFLFIIPFRSAAEGAMNKDMGVNAEDYTLGKIIKEILRSRQVWMSILADFFMSGAVLALSQVGPIALITYWGITDAEAGTILASSSIGSLIGYWVVPSVINKIGYRKRVFVPAGIIGLVLLGVPLLTKEPTIAMILLVFGGFLNACSLLGPRSIMMEHPTVAGVKAGTASGLLLTTNKISGVFYPAYFMAVLSLGVLAAWGLFFALAFIGVIFVALSDETGPKGRAALYKKYNIPLPEDMKAAEPKEQENK
jgi:predicted MFS family arabinose efflux permease